MAACTGHGDAIAARPDQHFSPGQAAGRHVGGEAGPRVTQLELVDIVGHLDDAPSQRLGATLRQLGVEQAGEVGRRRAVGLDHLQRRPRLERPEVGGSGLHLLVGDGLRRLKHQRHGQPGRPGIATRTALEVGHLLHEVRRRKAGQAGVLGAAGALGAVAGAAGPHIRLAAAGDHLGHRRMGVRVPVGREEQVTRLNPAEGLAAAGQALRHGVGHRYLEVRVPGVGPGGMVRRGRRSVRRRRHGLRLGCGRWQRRQPEGQQRGKGKARVHGQLRRSALRMGAHSALIRSRSGSVDVMLTAIAAAFPSVTDSDSVVARRHAKHSAGRALTHAIPDASMT